MDILLGWTAPEVWTGVGYDVRSDVFSLGRVLRELVTYVEIAFGAIVKFPVLADAALDRRRDTHSLDPEPQKWPGSVLVFTRLSTINYTEEVPENVGPLIGFVLCIRARVLISRRIDCRRPGARVDAPFAKLPIVWQQCSVW